MNFSFSLRCSIFSHQAPRICQSERTKTRTSSSLASLKLTSPPSQILTTILSPPVLIAQQHRPNSTSAPAAATLCYLSRFYSQMIILSHNYLRALRICDCLCTGRHLSSILNGLWPLSGRPEFGSWCWYQLSLATLPLASSRLSGTFLGEKQTSVCTC